MAHENRPTEKATSELIKSFLETQFDSVRKLAVETHTNFLNILQGHVDSISLEGQELVKDQIHVKAVDIEINDISIDPLSALLGEIKLNRPIDTSIQLVLTEADINQAINSELIREKIEPLDLVVNGEPLQLEMKPPFSVRLLDDRRIRFAGGVEIRGTQQTQQIAFSSVVMPRTDRDPILLENFCCSPKQGNSLPFVIALMQKLEALTSLPYYRFGETILRIVTLRIQNKNLILQIEAEAQQIPTL